jgi:hypothetical protein
MILVLGLVLLVAAVVAGVAGVLTNDGSAHALGPHGFSVLGYHVTGPTGTLFLYGIVVGALAVLGLGFVLSWARRTARLGRTARRSLEQSRVEAAMVARDRDDLIGQRDAARAETVDVRANSSGGDGPAVPVDGRPAPSEGTAAAPANN